jgi:hypothetical protein
MSFNWKQFFDIKFAVGKLKKGVEDLGNYVKDKYNKFVSYFDQGIDSKTLEDIVKNAAKEQLFKYNIKFTNRTEDIVEGFKCRVFTTGVSGKYYKISHDFFSGVDPTYTITGAMIGREKPPYTEKRYSTKGSTIFNAIEYGRTTIKYQAHGDMPLAWGYPYKKPNSRRRIASSVQLGNRGIYQDGIGMIKNAEQALQDYFDKRQVKIQRAAKSL